LKFDLFATQHWGAWLHLDLVEGPRKLLYGFYQRGTMQRALSRYAPQTSGLLDQPGLGTMTRQSSG
jgi:hypothetical protein